MLAPDAANTEQTVEKSFQAATLVTIYAAAMRFQVSPLLNLPLPGWFDPIKTDLETAIGHARTWQDALCGKIAIEVPQSFIDYNSVFQATSDQIINLITEIEMSGQSATSDQHQQANELLGSLLLQLGQESTTLGDLHGQVVQLMDEIQQDHTTISGAEATISQEIPDGGVISKQIQVELGNDFLDAQIQGTCSVSLSIKESIDMQIKQTAAANQELLPYVIALKILQKAQGDNEAATQALSAVVTSWQLLQDLLQDAITDLKRADDDQVLPILRQADVEAAQSIWAQLDEFATTLLTA